MRKQINYQFYMLFKHKISRARFVQILVAGLVVLPTTGVMAGEYKLIRGKQFELCRVFEKNLNSFKDETPMVCERKINQKLKDFKRPSWKRVNAKEYIAVLEQLYRYKQRNRTEAQFQQKWKKIKERLDAGKIILQQSNYDFDHDGTKEPVMKLTGLGCDSLKHKNFVRPVEPQLFVVIPNRVALDMRFKRGFSLSFDEFIYKGRSYISKWSGTPKKMIGIYEPFNVRGQMGIQNKPICEYNFID